MSTGTLTDKSYAIRSFQAPELLIERFTRDYECSKDHALALFGELKCFMAIRAANRGQKLSPSRIVDDMWHSFILFTREYFTFCELLGGRGYYIHHNPTKGGDRAAYQRTREILVATYGQINNCFWPFNTSAGSDDCDSPANCGCSADCF